MNWEFDMEIEKCVKLNVGHSESVWTIFFLSICFLCFKSLDHLTLLVGAFYYLYICYPKTGHSDPLNAIDV